MNSPPRCRHERCAYEVCLGCGAEVGTCVHCRETVALDTEGHIGYHDFPVPCRAICPGAKYSSVEEVARAALATGD